LGQFQQKSSGPNGGIAVGADGTIFVTDTWGAPVGRINRYAPDGKALAPLYPSGNQQFFGPRGLDTDSKGILYVADTGNNRILRFRANGTFDGVLTSGGMKEPVGVTVGPNGQIYVCDVGMRRVIAFTPQGKLSKQWPILGWSASSDDMIIWIEPYVAVDKKGFVYITDSTSNTVHRLDPTGQSVVRGGGKGRRPGNLSGPKGITIDSQGNLYIADSHNHRVIKARIQ